MSDWWSRKLGGQPHVPPPAEPRPPARVAPMPPQTPKNAPHIQVTAENFAEASTMWSGGDASRTEHGNCPNCGSALYFSRANGGTLYSERGQATPAPRCYECGFSPGREMQGVPPA